MLRCNEAPAPNTITEEMRFSTYEWDGGTYSARNRLVCLHQGQVTPKSVLSPVSQHRVKEKDLPPASSPLGLLGCQVPLFSRQWDKRIWRSRERTLDKYISWEASNEYVRRAKGQKQGPALFCIISINLYIISDDSNSSCRQFLPCQLNR